MTVGETERTMSLNPPTGWTVWSREDDGRLILAYRPDVFDAETYPAACLPTIYLTDGLDKRRPGAGQRHTDQWRVVLYLEPEVKVSADSYENHDAGIAGTIDIATRFAAGEIDYREAYQLPRQTYLDKLDELTRE